ncbi:MAG TPA: hypothetical protein PKD85_20395 [Saprospiraceae bacterium]|nr:hypothetical protein [Saprospiraceae bacterium]
MPKDKCISQQTNLCESLNFAKGEISIMLKKNKIKIEDKKFIYISTGQIKGYSSKNDCNSLDFQLKSSSNNILFGSHFVSALILDSDKNYKMRCTSNFLIKEPEKYTSYSEELKMIELALQNEYITFIDVMNCSESYIYGFKENALDKYQRINSDLVFIERIK